VTGARYDGLNRARFIGYGATAAAPTTYRNGVRYTWDGGDRVTKIESGRCAGVDCETFTVESVIDRVFDDLDRLRQETSAQGQVDYTYYATGLRETMTVAGQPTITYFYDPANRLTSVQQAAGVSNGNVAQTVGITYDNANRRDVVTLANGVTIKYGYDHANQLVSIVYRKANGDLIGDLTYAYDAAGQRSGSGGSLASLKLPADVSSASHNANNQVTNWQSGQATTLVYDADGNLSNDGTHWFIWNDRNQLAEVRRGGQSGTVVASYQYDAIGRRVSRTTGSDKVGYLYDGWNVAQELNGLVANAGKTNYRANVLNGLALDERFGRWVAPHSGNDNGPNNPSNPSSTAPLLSHFLTDGLASTVMVLRADQSTQAHYQYEAYGNTFQVTPQGQPVSDNPYQFTGRENEAASLSGNQGNQPLSGLYHYRHRFYSPKYSRFITEDPIGFEGGLNLYAYVNGRPVDTTDPTGEYGPVGFLGGVAFNFAVQMGTNLIQSGFDWKRSFRCVNWADVVISGAMGAIGPTFLGQVVGGKAGPLGFSRGVETFNWAARALPAGYAIKRVMPDFRIATDECECEGLSLGGLVGEVLH
jgi:RHS repeat-associated protein